MVRYDKEETNFVHFSRSTAFNYNDRVLLSSTGRNINHTMSVRNVDIVADCDTSAVVLVNRAFKLRFRDSGSS